jgi:aryl-alcohol dehydrogenase-like predicted oxidoreductase
VDAAVASGKVRYVGVSNYSGWQLATAANRQSGKAANIVSAQMEYSLLQRGIEREVLPAALALGAGILAWSPLGRGVLTGKYRHATPPDSRGATSHFASFVTPYLADKPRNITDAVCMAAEGLGVTPMDVALSWVTRQPGVSSAIVGARTAAQLRAILNGIDTTIPAEIIQALNDVSAPDRSYPEYGWNQL